MTTLDVVCMPRRETAVDAKNFVPAVRDGNKLWIDECTKARNDVGQGIVEVLIFSAAETMSFHHDAAAEKMVLLKSTGNFFGFIRGKDAFDNRVAFRVEVFGNLIPIGSHFVSRLPEPTLADFRFHAFKLESLFPMHGAPELRIEKFWIQLHVATNVGVLFGRHDLAVDHEDHFRRNPATAEFLILVELNLLRLLLVLTRGMKHADEVKIFLIDPELRRMQVARLGPHDIYWSALPGVFPELREVEFQCL